MGRIFALIIASAALGACASKPDLAFETLSLSTAAAAPGAEVRMLATVINKGKRPVADKYGAPIPAGVDVHIFERDNDVVPIGQTLSRWALPDEYPLGPGEAKSESTAFHAPMRLSPGPYFICGDIDPEGAVDEKNERNNRACAPFSILAGPLTRADLIIEHVKTLGHELASAKISIRVKNVGDAEANIFPVMAFTRWPRRPVMLTACPLTDAQRVSGTAPACGGLWTRQKLPPGGAVEWVGYLTFGFGGAEMPVTPIGPQRPTRDAITVDFMADGCFAPTDQEPQPRWCRVDEIDEINNFTEKVIRTRR